MTLAAILAGLHVSKQKLGDLRMVVFGAGSAGVGIADQIRDAIATEKGVGKDEAAKHIWLDSFQAVIHPNQTLTPWTG